jgi:hypothetical protein
VTRRPNLYEGEPYAEVERIGRWRYKVSVHHGVMRWGPDGLFWLVLGEKRAHRVARRKLAAYRRHRGLLGELVVVQ